MIESSFASWMNAVDELVMAKVGLSVRDLPVHDFFDDAYEAGVTPAQFFNEAVLPELDPRRSAPPANGAVIAAALGHCASATGLLARRRSPAAEPGVKRQAKRPPFRRSDDERDRALRAG